MLSRTLFLPDPTLPKSHIFCQTSPMKNLTITLCLTVAVLLGSAGMSWSAEIENKWTIDIHKDLKMVIASVNGLKTHGDRLTIQFYKKNKCVTGNATTTMLTLKNNPNLLNLRNRKVSSTFNDVELTPTIVSARKLSYANILFLNLGLNKPENIKKFFADKKTVSLILLNSENFKITDYLYNRELENSWSLNGLERALDDAQQECRKLR
jgi:hypothetical protein